ncbi:hypothetical protein AUJ14_02410 [Candidatus Micrarchaeota archaeon CG1_02_55_22]|nr:MAG: hypothetical protein AUJ14_02410 [Candidatus Micrarchaeota archaeon CG1_02_55_22]
MPFRYRLLHPIEGASGEGVSTNFGIHSSLGRVRGNQEDAALVAEISEDARRRKTRLRGAAPERALLAVFDGAGGYSQGDIASGAAVSHFSENAERLLSLPQDAEHASELERLVHSASEQVVGAVTDPKACTTAAAALVRGNSLHVAHAGDSRVYLMRNGRVEALTEDHLTSGQTPQGVQPLLTSALGNRVHLKVSVQQGVELKPGDAVVVVTDGVTKYVHEAGLAELIGGNRNAQAVAEAIVARADRRGGSDNSSAVVYFHGRSPKKTRAARQPKFDPRQLSREHRSIVSEPAPWYLIPFADRVSYINGRKEIRWRWRRR